MEPNTRIHIRLHSYYRNVIEPNDLPEDDNVTIERWAPARLLWIKVIIRAAYDYALWKDEKDIRKKKWAQDAENWLFKSSELLNGLESICYLLDIDVEAIRYKAKTLTKDQVKKMEFLERHGKDKFLRRFGELEEPRLALLGVLTSDSDNDNGNHK